MKLKERHDKDNIKARSGSFKLNSIQPMAHHDAQKKPEYIILRMNWYMGRNPNKLMQSSKLVHVAMQRNLHLFADLWNLAHLFPSIKLMIIARKKNHIQDNHAIHRIS